MRILKLTALAAICWTYSAIGYGFFDAQLLYSVQKKGAFEPSTGTLKDLKGTELKAAAHLSPIPLVPVSVGLAFSTVTFDKEATWGFNDFAGVEGGLEVSAWSPVALLGIVPYGKLNYLLYGNYAMDSTDTSTGTAIATKSLYNVKGSHIALGLKWSPLPLIGILLEYDMGTMTLEADEIKQSGVAVPISGSSSDLDYKSTAIFLGVEVGI